MDKILLSEKLTTLCSVWSNRLGTENITELLKYLTIIYNYNEKFDKKINCGEVQITSTYINRKYKKQNAIFVRNKTERVINNNSSASKIVNVQYIRVKIKQIQTMLELYVKFMKNDKTKSANYNQERMKDL